MATSMLLLWAVIGAGGEKIGVRNSIGVQQRQVIRTFLSRNRLFSKITPKLRESVHITRTAIVPPPPSSRPVGGDGDGEEDGDPEVIILHDMDRINCLQYWMKLCEETNSYALDGSKDVMLRMLNWREGPVGPNKRRFNLAIVRGGAVDAIVSLYLEPDNSNFLSFLQSKYVLTAHWIALSPTGSGLKQGSGTRLVQAVADLAETKGWRVSWDPLKKLYDGRFYLIAKS
mmetsp:Transcript_17742/g.26578  ORF Transcript_17742/g.26578 Transcript_17742/m.26578 type:complete len:229 (-) Transcript_17742:55-741(-)